MPVLSVIVPIFGVEKYIERCARSLFSQTMDDIEFIFVNDFTQDSAMSVLKGVINEYPDRQVRIINHERNMGLPMARRTGLIEATGEYILHCDSDDWLEPESCEVLVNTAKSTDADIVVFKNWIDDGNSSLEDNRYDDAALANKATALSAAISLKSSPFVWNKLVRREIYDNPIVFPIHNLAEDWVLSVQFAYYSGKTVCIEDKLYHYFRNADSIMGVVSKDACLKKCSDEIANVTLICDWLQEKGLSKKYKWEIVKRKTITKSQLMPIIDDKQACKMWRRTFAEINVPVLFSPDFGLRYKLRHLLLTVGLYRPFRRFRQLCYRFFIDV